LTRREEGFSRRLAVTVITLAASALIHGGALAATFAIAAFIGDGHGKSEESDETVEVDIIDRRPEPVPKVEPEPPALPVPVPVEKPKPVKRSRPPQKAPVAQAPPAPVDMPDEAPGEPTDTPDEMRIVGVSLESTVTGGDGPAVAVGNTGTGMGSRVVRGSTTTVPAPDRITRPTKVSMPEPVYPRSLMRRGIEDDVVLKVALGTDGRVDRVKVVRGSRYNAFNRAAVAAARKAIYEPARANGEPISTTIRFVVRFQLD
jgi:protein TonB